MGEGDEIWLYVNSGNTPIITNMGVLPEMVKGISRFAILWGTGEPFRIVHIFYLHLTGFFT